MSFPQTRDVEAELWKVYEHLDGNGLDVADRRLKALELVVKIRSAWTKVKPATPDGDAETVERARRGSGK
jgi:hypothetical protein